MFRVPSPVVLAVSAVAVVGFIAVATLSVFFWAADVGAVALPALAVAMAVVGLRFKKSLRLDRRVRSAVNAPGIFHPTFARWLADRSPRPVLLKLGLVAAFACGGTLGMLLGMPGVAPAPQAPEPPAPTSLASISEPPARAPLLVQPLAPIPVEAAKPPTPASPPPSADVQTLSSEEVLEVQAWLKAFGFDPGPLDGMRGPQTVAAVKRYQIARRKEETGLLDRSLLQQVRQQAGHSGR